MPANDSRVKGRNNERSSSETDDKSSDIAACVGSDCTASCLVDTACKSRLLTLLLFQVLASDDDGGSQLLLLQFPCRRRLPKLLSLLKMQLLF
jgi:hypothetical protein